MISAGKGGWVWSILTVAFCTVVAILAFRYFELVDVAMIYLMGVVIAASRTTKWPAMLAALLSVAAFDFFFVPPRFTFAVGDTQHFITFAVMFFVALVISRFTLRIRQQADDAKLKEQRTSALYDLNRKLVREREKDKLKTIAEQHIGLLFNSNVVILLPDLHGKLLPPVDDFPWTEAEREAAQWAFNNRQPAGLNALTGPDAKALYLPLMASTGNIGVVGLLRRKADDKLDQEQLRYLEAFINQTGIAIERALLAEESHRASVKAETESLRNTLLSSISHDLRTPLTAVTGAVSTLLSDATLDKQNQRELFETIQDESERLNRIIKNVLAMTRLEAGGIVPQKEWQSLEEIVGVVLHRLSQRLIDHPLTINLPPNLPLISFDGLLLEQVFMNLFENAIKYTPAGTPLSLSASKDLHTVTVELADRGPGIPPGNEERIFDKFYRGRNSGGGGVGLGLAICQAIITAHGGRIWAENREGGGAVFRFTLSSAGAPPLEEERATE